MINADNLHPSARRFVSQDVECAFGRMKGRWRCLKATCLFHKEVDVANQFKTCVVLQNRVSEFLDRGAAHKLWETDCTWDGADGTFDDAEVAELRQAYGHLVMQNQRDGFRPALISAEWDNSGVVLFPPAGTPRRDSVWRSNPAGLLSARFLSITLPTSIARVTLPGYRPSDSCHAPQCIDNCEVNARTINSKSCLCPTLVSVTGSVLHSTALRCCSSSSRPRCTLGGSRLSRRVGSRLNYHRGCSCDFDFVVAIDVPA
jgi:hypothetical protein